MFRSSEFKNFLVFNLPSMTWKTWKCGKWNLGPSDSVRFKMKQANPMGSSHVWVVRHDVQCTVQGYRDATWMHVIPTQPDGVTFFPKEKIQQKWWLDNEWQYLVKSKSESHDWRQTSDKRTWHVMEHFPFRISCRFLHGKPVLLWILKVRWVKETGSPVHQHILQFSESNFGKSCKVAANGQWKHLDPKSTCSMKRAAFLFSVLGLLFFVRNNVLISCLYWNSDTGNEIAKQHFSQDHRHANRNLRRLPCFLGETASEFLQISVQKINSTFLHRHFKKGPICLEAKLDILMILFGWWWHFLKALKTVVF